MAERDDHDDPATRDGRTGSRRGAALAGGREGAGREGGRDSLDEGGQPAERRVEAPTVTPPIEELIEATEASRVPVDVAALDAVAVAVGLAAGVPEGQLLERFLDAREARSHYLEQEFGTPDARSREDRLEPDERRAWSDLDALYRLLLFVRLETPLDPPRSSEQLDALVTVEVAALGRRLSAGVDAVLHHDRFQRLEASWRGLKSLHEESQRHERAVVRVLDISWRELSNDLERAVDFDQSKLFARVYTDEFDMPGGTPYGLLIGDYQLGGQRDGRSGGGEYTAASRLQEVRTLELASQVAAAAFAPLVLGVGPEFFGLSELGDLERPIDLSRVFEQPEFASWRELRRSEDARFVALTLPRVLMRTPLAPDAERVDGFPFRERCTRHTDYLWGNAAYAFGGIVLRDFGQSGWTGAIRGVERDTESGGIVRSLVHDRFRTDVSEAATKQAVEVQLTDQREKALSDLGFLPLSHCPHTPFAAFHGSSSIQRPESFGDHVATINARISSLVQSMLCVSRFAHYVKVIGRDKVGSFQSADQVQTFLNNWLVDYCTVGDDLSPEVKARYPLREGRVDVRELPGRPGVYACNVHLRPHYQLDQLTAAIRLTTELAPTRRD